MLQQIIRDMYIDPELLAELSEHQKELLFVKMREEQVRRWKERQLEESKKPKVKKNGSKRITWRQGRDGCEWVWVMGEHRNDQTIDQILERENIEKARHLAQKEAEEKRKRGEEERRRRQKEEEEKRKKLKEEEERLEREKKELEEEKKKAEAAAYASLKELREQKLRLEREEAEKKRKEEELRKKQEQLRKEKEDEERRRREREEQLRKEEEVRKEELYMSLIKIREEQSKAAIKDKEEVDKIFQRQLRESKKADRNKRDRANVAREEIRRSRMSKDMSNINIEEIVRNKNITPPERPSEPPSLPPRKKQAPRPPKPTGKKSVVEWFQKEEACRNAGLLRETMKVAPWFHGIITRQQAEYLLYPMEAGHFLVRVSERIWGYALSFRDKDRAKHFLIDASGSSYCFFGPDQMSHASLEDLVNYHMHSPISALGKEILATPCGQNENEPSDYQDLFSNLKNQNTPL